MSTSPSPITEPSPPPQRGSGRGAAAAVGAGLLAVLAKFKGGLVLLKGLKFGKLLLTMGSMFVMVWFEAVRYGWLFGLGFVLLILVHELGHGLAIKRGGSRGGLPGIHPLLRRAHLAQGEAALGAGRGGDRAGRPGIAGTAAALVCAGIWFATHGRLWLALAHVGFFLNLFNMTPLPPLDGGRVAKLFSRRAWIVGALVIGGMFLATQTPQLLLIGLMALLHRPAAPPDLEEVPVAQRRNMAAHYFGLCAFLAAGTWMASQMLGHGS